MTEPTNRSDLVLSPGEYAYYQDTTKGTLLVNVGPSKTSLSNTDQLVRFDRLTRKFDKVTYVEQAIEAYPNAGEGQYIVLSNPCRGESDHPKEGLGQPAAKLEMGRKVNIPGPAYFSLWPGQHAEVVEGHHLHSNQYLLVRVYNEEEAKANWNKAVVKSASGDAEPATPAAPPNLTMGQLMIVRGTEISFYIPPTGIEVVPEEDGDYIRDAVTLERLEYCILLSESGEKRYVPGPDVVFPDPTEGFVRDDKNNSRKFRAIELSPISGIHIKVIADYEERSTQYHAGDELFITGKDQAIYFPREEHSIITYGDRKIYYAIAVPEGEGRYVLNRETGVVDLVTGPVMFLPDPRVEVVVRRVLDPKTVELLYPGNVEALKVNNELAEASRLQGSPDYLASMTGGGSASATAAASYMASNSSDGIGAEISTRNFMRAGRASPTEKLGDFQAEKFNRGTSYTPPRSITLDTKYDGAIAINVWTGYAVLIVNKAGDRRVVVGPETVLLAYDESLMALELSTGTPKTDRYIKTAYLRVTNNKVSDRVDAETKDLVKVSLELSYRLNFEGSDDKATKWFDVENYIKFMTDHMRSLIRNVVKRTGIEEFYGNSIDIIRDAVLGASVEGTGRPGKLFKENSMRIYDVEVLTTDIKDPAVQQLLQQAQQDAISGSIRVVMQTANLERTTKLEEINRNLLIETEKTASARHEVSLETVRRTAERELAEMTADTERETAEKNAEIALTGLEDELTKLTLGIELEQAEQRQNITKTDDALLAARETLGTDLFVKRTEALSEKITAALQTLGDKIVMESVTKALAPLAVLGQTNVSEILSQLFKGGPAEDLVRTLSARPTFLNGAAKQVEDRHSDH
jgi:major vault protein